MAHHHTHGGNARAAQRRGELYAQCATCGQRSYRFQAEKPETFSEFVEAMAVAVMLVAALYVLVLAAYGMGPR